MRFSTIMYTATVVIDVTDYYDVQIPTMLVVHGS